MSVNSTHITVHMVCSLDGMIARKDNSIGWFESSSPYEKGVSGQDPEAFLKTIDCYVMGSKTYELALALSKEYGWAYGDKPTIVLSSRQFPEERTQISFFSGNLGSLVNEKLKPRYRNVWVVGGAAVVSEFIRLRLATEIRLSILPVLLGEGTPFFKEIGGEQALMLKDVLAYKNGMVELIYGLKD